MVERIKKLFLEGKLTDKGVRNAAAQGLITAADASYILSSSASEGGN